MRYWMRTALVGAAVLGMQAAAALQAYEEPKYTVQETDGAVELRRYAPRIAVETTASGGYNEASNAAFMRLFRYIGGENKPAKKVEMTVPVTTVGGDPTFEGDKVAMTVPVTMTSQDGTRDAGKSMRMQFFLPSSFSMETAPQPTDERVTLRQEPDALVAALRYSGDYSKPRFEKKLAELRVWIKGRGLDEAGPPMNAVYNGPFTPGFLRRNEVLIPVKDAGASVPKSD